MEVVMADKIRIGIIGAGGIFRTRHFPGLAQIDDAEVVAICNRSEESGGKIAAEFGLSPDLMTDPYALMARDDIDAVMIGTWPYKTLRVCPRIPQCGQARICAGAHGNEFARGKNHVCRSNGIRPRAPDMPATARTKRRLVHAAVDRRRICWRYSQHRHPLNDAWGY